MKKTIGIVMVLLMLMSVTVAWAGNAKDAETGGEKVKVIIGYTDKPNQADEDVIRGQGGNTKYTYHIINAKAVEISEHAIDRIKRNPRVAYVEEDAKVYALEDELNNSWGVERIGAGVVHDGGNTGAGVNVSIIDSGIDYTHQDLDDNFDSELLGYDFVNGDDYPMDDYGHGTHCAGIVAAEDNNEGVVGVAPNASLYAVKVLGADGIGYTSDVAAGIEWSVDNGMQIISMSLGGGPSDSLENACNNAYDSGIVVVAAAGNSGAPRGRATTTVGYPARYASVIAVSATNDADTIASFSSRGEEVELAAPGVDILSTYPGGYATGSGTSMACPHVSGTAALVIASGITDNDKVRARLWNTAEDMGDLGLDTKYGYGLVDAEAAAASVVTLESITVTPETASIPKGLTEQYTATGTYSDGSTLDITSSVNWASSDTGVAIIDSTGLATGEGEGTTTITASSNSISDTATLMVVTQVLEPTTVSVSSIDYSTEGGRDGKRHLLITVALDDLNNPVADASVSITVYLGESPYDSYTGTTGTGGTVTFKANNAPSGIYTTTVTAVTAEGLHWGGVTPENSFTK